MKAQIWKIQHAPLDDVYMVTRTPETAPDKAAYVEIDFEKGLPVAVDGKKLEAVALLEKLNALGAEHGVGITDMVENRLVGMKSRGIYENPGVLARVVAELQNRAGSLRVVAAESGVAADTVLRIKNSENDPG